MNEIQLTGLEKLQRQWAENTLIADQPTHLNLTVKQIEQNLVICEVVADQGYINSAGLVKGDFATSVLDYATYCVAQTVLKSGFTHQSVDLNVKFCQQIPANRVLACEAKVVNVGRSIIITEAVICDSDGEIYTYASATHKILRPKMDN